MYVYTVGDLRTGRITATLPLSGDKWSHPLNDAHTFSGTVDLSTRENRHLNLRFTAAAARSFWMVEWDGLPCAGGVLWTHRYKRKPSPSLQLGGAGLSSLWDHRKVLPASGFDQVPAASADTTISGVDLGTIAKRLIAQAIAHTGGNLPIVLPADVAGTAARTYESYSLKSVGEALQQLTAVEDGPDIDFMPRRVAGDESRIEWQMLIGRPYLEQTGGNPWLWDDTVEKSAVVDLGVDIDGSVLAARAWVPGVGTERSQLFGLAQSSELVNAGYPLLEVEEAHSSTEVQATLDSTAAGLVARRSRPLEQWSLQVRADADPVLGTYQPGDSAIVRVEDDPYIPDGEQGVRITGISGGGSSVVSLELAPDSAIV